MLSLVNNIKNYIRHNPTPIDNNVSYMWSIGSVSGILLAMQWVTGSYLQYINGLLSLFCFFLIGRDTSEAAGKAIIDGKEVYYVKFPESWNTVPSEPSKIDALLDLFQNAAYFPESPLYFISILAIVTVPLTLFSISKKPRKLSRFVVDKFYSFILYFFAAVILTALVYAFSTYTAGSYYELPQVYKWYHHLRADNFTFHIKIVIILLGFGTLMTINIYERGRQQSNRWKFLLIFLSIPNLLILVSANHLVTLYVLVEIVSIISYTLVALTRTKEQDRVVETAFTYFVQGSLASALLLLGIISSYLITGDWTFDVVSYALRTITESGTLTHGHKLSVFLIFIGLLFKVGVIPGHLWIERVYADVSDPVLLFFTTAVKFGFLITFIRVYYMFLPAIVNHYSYLILTIAVISILVGFYGGLIAEEQQNWKNFIAFTSVNQIGYVVAGLTFFDSESLLESAVYYLLTYIISNFVFVASLAHIQRLVYPTDLRTSGGDVTLITPITPEEREDGYVLATFTAASAWSIAGLPPIVGFFGKLTLLSELSNVVKESGDYSRNPSTIPSFWQGKGYDFADLYSMAQLTLVFVVVISIFSIYYYLKVLEWVFDTFRGTGLFISAQSIKSRNTDIEDRKHDGTDIGEQDKDAMAGYSRSHRRTFICISVFTFIMVFWVFIVTVDPFSIPVFCKLPYHKFPL